MNVLRSLVAVAALASLTIACAESSTTLTAPSSDQLSGTWTLVSMQLAGQSVQAAPAGATYALTFSDGRLSTRVDCNTCNGTFGFSGQTLTAGPALACTRAACPTMAFENEYTRLLAGDSSVTLSANTLVLSSSRGTLRYTR
jgi:heat shock protein HslJ